MALAIAMASNYDRAVYIEADALFALPVAWGFDQLTKPIGCQPSCGYYSADWHVWWIKDLKWFRAFDWWGKYDWPNRVGDRRGEPAGEVLYERIFSEHLQRLPVRGNRGEVLRLNAHNYHALFPRGCHIVTHVDAHCAEVFLADNGFHDLIPKLYPPV